MATLTGCVHILTNDAYTLRGFSLAFQNLIEELRHSHNRIHNGFRFTTSGETNMTKKGGNNRNTDTMENENDRWRRDACVTPLVFSQIFPRGRGKCSA